MGRERMVSVAVLAALCIMAFETAALADQSTEGGGSGSGEVVLEGSGWLYAKGTGEAILNMGGSVRMYVDGDVKIEDHAGDLVVWIEGVVSATADTDFALEDFQGRLRVRGSDFTLKAEGSMEFVAHGYGVAKLEGRGVFRTRHSRLHPWDMPAAA